MEKLKLLIADDLQENRAHLREICHTMEGFEIKEACDGIEAIEIVDAWRPHIIIMDVMMPRMDGFEASKIIKTRYPQTIIMALTTVNDPHMEKNMASIGVATYIRKSADKEFIRFKLQSIGALLHSKEGEFHVLSQKKALNFFNADIRNFRTIFNITDSEAMMDFGMWILGRCEEKMTTSRSKIDMALGLFYELMRHGTREGQSLNIVVEESFEEIYATMEFEEFINPKPKATVLLNELGTECIIRENTVCIRLRKMNDLSVVPKENISAVCEIPAAPVILSTQTATFDTKAPVSQTFPAEFEPKISKEVKVIESNEKEMLRQSFVRKTAATEYIKEIGGDILEEIRDLESLDEEWIDKLHILGEVPTEENIRGFTDGVLTVYTRAINNLFEFTALAYALSSLGSFLKEHSEVLLNDPAKLKKLVMLLEHLGADLSSWRQHIFALQDTADIHYLDSSFFSSCMQIETIIGNKEVSTDDDDDGMEFF